MAVRGGIALVRSYIKEQSVADAVAGLEVRRCVLRFVEDHRHPAGAALLKQIEALDRVLVEGGNEYILGARRRDALQALDEFANALDAEKIVSLADHIQRR